MKNVVSLDSFLKMNPATALLAPNLEDQQRESVIDNLVIIAAREDVKAVLVGILPDDGNVSDSVLIKTYASDEEVRSWPRVLQTGFQRLSRYKYEIDGKTRNVRNLLFVWD